MLRHIVLMKLKNFSENEKKENLHKLQMELIKLKDKIEEVRMLETGLNISTRPTAYDLSLICDFDNEDSLNAYRIHPEHIKVLELIKELVDKTAVNDFYREG